MIRENRNKIILIAVTVVLTVILVVMVINDKKQEQGQEEHLQQLQVEASPYEQKIQEITDDLSKTKREINSVENVSQISFVYQVETAADIEWMEAQNSNLNYPVTGVINIANEKWIDLIERISVSSVGMDIMFSGITDYDTYSDRIQEISMAAQDKDIPVASMWFLLDGEYTDKNMELLNLHGISGFTQLTNYASNIVTGKTKNGLFFVEHVPVKAGRNRVVSSIKLSVQEKKPILLSFDVAELRSTTQSQIFIKEALDEIHANVSDNLTSVISVSRLIEQQTLQDMGIADKQASYEKYEAEQQLHIDELQKKIDEIYRNWKVK